MLNWIRLAGLTNEELAKVDIGAVNLACTRGLPRADAVDHADILRRVDNLAMKVGQRTERLRPRFRETGYTSEPFWRARAMVALLTRHLGVRYNMAKADPTTTLDPEDSFIHGIFVSQGGTCASLPVLFAAVGRRLGYPIRLATVVGETPGFPGHTVGHVFARWDGQDERFNIDHYDGDFISATDDDIREKYAVTPDTERDGGLMVSLTPQQELALFLRERAMHQPITLRKGDQCHRTTTRTHHRPVSRRTSTWATTPDADGCTSGCWVGCWLISRCGTPRIICPRITCSTQRGRRLRAGCPAS
jgi:hypothetical protein